MKDLDFKKNKLISTRPNYVDVEMKMTLWKRHFTRIHFSKTDVHSIPNMHNDMQGCASVEPVSHQCKTVEFAQMDRTFESRFGINILVIIK